MSDDGTGKKKNAWAGKQVEGAVKGGLIGLGLAGVPGAVAGAVVGSRVAPHRHPQDILRQTMRRAASGPWRIHPDGTID